MVIEVIARQVSEHRHVELQGGDTPLIQAMGGHLHGHGARTGLFERGQGGLHPDRIRRGVLALLQGTVEAITQCADDTAALAEQIQCLRQ